MNRHLSDLPGEGEQRDPVADFFARERADIRDLPAGADRWESILVEARRPVRRSWLPYLAGAAAVVLVGGVLWGNGRGPGTDRAADPASSTTVGTIGAPRACRSSRYDLCVFQRRSASGFHSSDVVLARSAQAMNSSRWCT